MAVYLLKASQRSGYTPPAAVGVFGDVPAGDSFAPWIEDLYNRQVTAGYQAMPLLYCPSDPNAQGQMAVFLVKTFALSLYSTSEPGAAGHRSLQLRQPEVQD